MCVWLYKKYRGSTSLQNKIAPRKKHNTLRKFKWKVNLPPPPHFDVPLGSASGVSASKKIFLKGDYWMKYIKRM